MSENFKLSKSGYDVITKILHAYGLLGDGESSLDEVSQKAGLSKSMVSRNNGFLKSVGILQGGNNKELTEKGKLLAIAIGNSLEEDIKDRWVDIILNCDETKAIIDMLKVQNGVNTDQFTGKMASTLGVINNENNSTGLNTIEEILKLTNLIKEENGTVNYNADFSKKGNGTRKNSSNEEPKGGTPKSGTEGEEKPLNKINLFRPDLHINMQIHISPETKPEQIEKIFESMNKYLKDFNE